MALLWIPAVAAGAAIAFWLLITTEGTYLGSGVVALLYDWVAGRYDRIKKLHYVDEAVYLGQPLVEQLAAMPAPRVLDVATGTGRVPLALLREYDFDGTVTGVDRSARMLAEARRALAAFGGRCRLQWADAARLPYADESFECVTCLEALEFMTHPTQVLGELLRVLAPGGLLVLSNRVGTEARFFPGRIAGRGNLERRLRRLGITDIKTEIWQVHYDQVWARKNPSEICSPLPRPRGRGGGGEGYAKHHDTPCQGVR